MLKTLKTLKIIHILLGSFVLTALSYHLLALCFGHNTNETNLIGIIVAFGIGAMGGTCVCDELG